MLLKNDYLYLIWKDPQTRRNFTIGKLSRGENYTFEYCEEASEAEECGWKMMDAFAKNKVYKSNTIFPVFSSRLPDKKRRDIKKILEKYELSDYDEFELLRKSGARLPIDTYEFIDPISAEENPIERDFFVMGIRYNTECEGKNCTMLPDVNIGDFLILESESDNKYDPLAIRVITQKGKHLGYIPRYYNKAIIDRLNLGMTYSCKVLEIHSSQSCSECVKIRLNMPEITS